MGHSWYCGQRCGGLGRFGGVLDPVDDSFDGVGRDGAGPDGASFLFLGCVTRLLGN